MEKESLNTHTTTAESVAPVATQSTSETQVTTIQTSKMQNALILIVGVLVFMAGVQVFQTQQLMAAVSSGSINSATQAPAQGGSTLPSQVGGCG